MDTSESRSRADEARSDELIGTPRRRVSALRPPAGHPPPQTARLDDGGEIELGPLAGRIADLYANEFPDDLERYGPAGRDWCVHDNLHLLAWAFGHHRGYVVFGDQAR